MNKHSLTGAAVVAAAALLSACGGGGGDSGAPPDAGGSVPASASESSASLVAFLKELAAAMSEMAEPLSVGGFEPVTPDDTEPEAVD